MVLWEITLATAYFLGLKRTYKLALRLQKRLIGPKHPKARQFVYSKIRSIFDVAVSVHQNVQQRDIEVGRNLGNRILRWLDRMKPSAQIRGPHEKPPNASNRSSSSIPKHTVSSGQETQKSNMKITDVASKGRMLFSSLNMRPKSILSIAMMMQPTRPAGMNGQYRHFSHYTPCALALDYRLGKPENGVFRKDIALWMAA